MKELTYNFIPASNYYHKFPCSSPTPNRKYVRFLKYVSDHPGCTRKEANSAVHFKYAGRASMSTEWASIHQAELIKLFRDSRTVRYYITEKGENLLKSLNLK